MIFELLQTPQASDVRDGEWDGWYWSVPFPLKVSAQFPFVQMAEEVASEARKNGNVRDGLAQLLTFKPTRSLVSNAIVEVPPGFNQQMPLEFQNSWAKFLSGYWTPAQPNKGGRDLAAGKNGFLCGEILAYSERGSTKSAFRQSALHPLGDKWSGWRWSEPVPRVYSQPLPMRQFIRLGAEATKTKSARIIALSARVVETLKQQPRSISGYVFVNPKTDKPWNQIKKVFARARHEAGMDHIWFHDLRRSFVTNWRRSGVPESVIMRMTGHKTPAVFARYNIVSDDDLHAGVAFVEQQEIVRAKNMSESRGKDLERLGSEG